MMKTRFLAGTAALLMAASPLLAQAPQPAAPSAPARAAPAQPAAPTAPAPARPAAPAAAQPAQPVRPAAPAAAQPAQPARPAAPAAAQPAAQPAQPARPAAAAPAAAQGQRINLNTAGQADLDKLPQIGDARAKAILAERAKGRFTNWDNFVQRMQGSPVNQTAKDAIKDKVSF